VQQGGARASRYPLMRDVEVSDLIPDFILDGVRSGARSIPGYSVLGAILGKDPLTDAPLPTGPTAFVDQLLTPGPFGTTVGPVLDAIDIAGDGVRLLRDGLAAHDLTAEPSTRDLGAAWDELSVPEGVSGNLAITEGYVDAIV